MGDRYDSLLSAAAATANSAFGILKIFSSVTNWMIKFSYHQF